MSGLGDQIAVLDGLAAMDPTDGRIGQTRAQVTQYAKPVMPGVLSRKMVLDASAGANYSGGSSYAPGLPLMPSSIGLAGLRNIPGVLPERQHVVDYSGGALYSGGSSYVPGLPLLPSSSGLADSFIRGGYGRAGLGASMVDGGYGRAGLGQTASAVDEDLAAAAEAVATAKALNPEDGRIGQQRAQVDEYGRPVMPGVLARSNVIDASDGANYSGGSSYAVGLPLMPSSVGLAGLELRAYDDLDALSDEAVGLPKALKNVAGKNRVNGVKSAALKIAKRVGRMTPAQRMKAREQVQKLGNQLNVARRVRRAAYNRKYAQQLPLWAR